MPFVFLCASLVLILQWLFCFYSSPPITTSVPKLSAFSCLPSTFHMVVFAVLPRASVVTFLHFDSFGQLQKSNRVAVGFLNRHSRPQSIQLSAEPFSGNNQLKSLFISGFHFISFTCSLYAGRFLSST